MAQRNLTTCDFIEKAMNVHGDLYDYSKSVYEVTVKPVIITCRHHGDFKQSPKCHLSGRGCPACGNSRKRSGKDSFVEKAIKKHGARYDYTDTVYTNTRTKLAIRCIEHGNFYQLPNQHVGGHGCPECGKRDRRESRLRTVEEFTTLADKVHDKTYDYSNVVYNGAYVNVEIVCKRHGVFRQTPNNHLQGNGCPKCSKYGFNSDVNGVVYTLVSECGMFIKIGVTCDADRRFSELRKSTPFRWSVLTIEHMSGEDALRVEKERHSHLTCAGMTGFNGCSEWFINPCK